ncbi:MAG TPA: ABC transporter substrate-binding protein [Candidatus Binatia bacterium]|nr:ABC transporter substrate-binding protein [Candidatus Binatia bacterium]
MTRKVFSFVPCVMLFALCFSAEAQQPRKVPRIGYLSQASRSVFDEAFLQGLRDLGYIEGKNIVIEYRFAEAKRARLPEFAAELVKLKVDLIVADGTATGAARQTTQIIPIVMTAGGDPVAAGYVASLARPGGNITGLSTQSRDLSGKWLELLKEAAPKILRVAALHAPTGSAAGQLQEIEVAARLLNVRVQPVPVQTPDDIGQAFAVVQNELAEAIILVPNLMFLNNRKKIADLTLKYRLPMISQSSQIAEAGGLMSYGAHIQDLFRRAAYYVDKILKGAKPADLPVEQPTKFEMVINLKTAKQIGLTIPPNVLARADRIIK